MLASHPVSSPKAPPQQSPSMVPMPQPQRISGRDNPEFRRFAAVRSRKDRDLILVEGPKLLEEAIGSGLPVRVVALGDRAAHPSGGLRAARVVHFSAPLMKALADVETHQGVLALVERPRPSRAWLDQARAFILILDGVQDPGNVGTLFRTAEAAGVSGVLLTRGCADPLSPKALRASAGSAFRLAHVPDLMIESLFECLPTGVKIVGAAARAGADSAFDTPLTLPLALALGSEGSGLSPQLEAAASRHVRIPAARPIESLNVAVAGAVLMFEVARRAGTLQS